MSMNTLKTVKLIERDIKLGAIKTTKELIARKNKEGLAYPVYYKLYKLLKTMGA